MSAAATFAATGLGDTLAGAGARVATGLVTSRMLGFGLRQSVDFRLDLLRAL
jgi:hypothetical protein